MAAPSSSMPIVEFIPQSGTMNLATATCTFIVLLQFCKRTRNKAFSEPRNTFLRCVSAKPYQNVWARTYGYFYGRLCFTARVQQRCPGWRPLQNRFMHLCLWCMFCTYVLSGCTDRKLLIYICPKLIYHYNVKHQMWKSSFKIRIPWDLLYSPNTGFKIQKKNIL